MPLRKIRLKIISLKTCLERNNEKKKELKKEELKVEEKKIWIKAHEDGPDR